MKKLIISVWAFIALPLFAQRDANIRIYPEQDVYKRQEKAREFYFEAQRRTDLIRYNKFTSNYTWDWKGETAGGTSISSHFSLLPIPSTQLVANSNLKQNPGY